MRDFQVNPYKILSPESAKKRSDKVQNRRMYIIGLLKLFRENSQKIWRMGDLQAELQKVYPKLGFADMLACIENLVESRRILKTPAKGGKYHTYQLIT